MGLFNGPWAEASTYKKLQDGFQLIILSCVEQLIEDLLITTMIKKSLLKSALVLAASLLLIPTADARRIKNMPNPDFTQGEVIPDGAVHDWTLGATGARG